MLELILAWARLDSSLTMFMVRAFNTTTDYGALMVGNMQSRDKIEKLRALYKHHKMTEALQDIAILERLHRHYVDSRNAIAHHVCLGMYRGSDALIFSAGKVALGVKGNVVAQGYSLEHMRAATSFARKASSLLFAEAEKPLPSTPPAELPSFQSLPHPTPRENERDKRSKQPQAAPR